MSVHAEPRKKPPRPPVTKTEMKPRANSIGDVNWIRASHRLTTQHSTRIADGIVISSVVRAKTPPSSGIHAADEHVMSPNDQAQRDDRDPAAGHDLVAEDRLADECREDLRGNSHRRNDDDVHLGMTEEPEQVLPQQRMASGVGDQLVAHHQARRHEETRSGNPVGQQQNSGSQQHRKDQDRNQRTRKHPPNVQRQALHQHALRARLQNRRDVVQHAHHRGHGEQARSRESRSSGRQPCPGPASGTALSGAYAVHPEIGAPPSTKKARMTVRHDNK